TPEHRYAIFEMGMNQVGEMERLLAIVEPQIGVITNISGAHAGNFADGIYGVRREKGQMYKSIAGRGHAVINLDDENVFLEAERHQFKSQLYFGRAKEADIRIVETLPFELTTGCQMMKIDVEGERFSVAIPLAGVHHAMNAACALAVIKALELSPE